jgi:exopolyphosphatase/guanosine-5'-triphosphate,3'-diphosphate pyrophosphatase
MQTRRRAVIDVGTNSVKLLIGDVTSRRVEPVIEISRQTRLGRGFYQGRRLQPKEIAATGRAVAEFADRARAAGAADIRIIATSAARDAANPADLTSALEASAGLKVEVISGQQEAAWAFLGVSSQSELGREKMLVLDVGGGSTEFILGRAGQTHFSGSYPLGTVRLMEQIPHGDPPSVAERDACVRWLEDFLRHELRPDLNPALKRETGAGGSGGAVRLVGTGGTAGVLGCMEARLETFDRERLEATRLSLERLHEHGDRLWNLPLGERRKIRGLPPERADVILTGVAIYATIMTEFGFKELRISTRGLRFGVLMAA